MAEGPTITWADARAIAGGALGRAHSDPQERQALARLIEQVRTRPRECCTWSGHCMDCPRSCPLGRKDEEIDPEGVTETFRRAG